MVGDIDSFCCFLVDAQRTILEFYDDGAACPAAIALEQIAHAVGDLYYWQCVFARITLLLYHQFSELCRDLFRCEIVCSEV